jgi:FixJ family two-component response regulator
MLPRGLTIAVIDDDEGVRTTLRQLLRAVGFRAVTFGSAEEFLAEADPVDAACLIVDINLPGMNGAALVHALRDAGRQLPSVLISARDDARTLALVRSCSPSPFLRKPFSDDELLAAIERAVDG